MKKFLLLFTLLILAQNIAVSYSVYDEPGERMLRENINRTQEQLYRQQQLQLQQQQLQQQRQFNNQMLNMQRQQQVRQMYNNAIPNGTGFINWSSF